MNQVWLIGNLTDDPKCSATASGVSRCAFTLVTNRKYTGQDGKREADYHTIVAWRQLADICRRYLSKGRQCAVKGSLQYRRYTAQDGGTRYMTEIIAEEVKFLGGGKGQPSSEMQEDADPETGYTPVETDELPF